MNSEQKNILTLSLCLALTLTGHILIYPVVSLVGLKLSGQPSLAVVPICLSYLSGTFVSVGAAFFMQRWGRPKGFMIGALSTIVSAAVSYQAIVSDSFLLFCLGSLFYGVQLGIAPYYRFAALEAASPGVQSRALGLVMSGGIVAALLGPTLSGASVSLLPVEYEGNFLIFGLLPLGILVLLTQVKLPQPAVHPKGRPLRKIIKAPQFLLALAACVIGYGVMSLIMIATPMAMKADGLAFTGITSVIKWHMLGMFLPGFFTGALIQRFGCTKVILTGVLINLAAITINYGPMDLTQYIFSLLLLGVGWNFLYLGSTQLLAKCYQPGEAAKVQGFNESVTLAVNSASALSAGVLYQHLGWAGVSLSAVPALVGVVLMALLLIYSNRLAKA